MTWYRKWKKTRMMSLLLDTQLNSRKTNNLKRKRWDQNYSFKTFKIIPKKFTNTLKGWLLTEEEDDFPKVVLLMQRVLRLLHLPSSSRSTSKAFSSCPKLKSCVKFLSQDDLWWSQWLLAVGLGSSCSQSRRHRRANLDRGEAIIVDSRLRWIMLMLSEHPLLFYLANRINIKLHLSNCHTWPGIQHIVF